MRQRFILEMRFEYRWHIKHDKSIAFSKLKVGRGECPVAARKRVTGTNQAHYRSGTCNRDLAEQQKNSNVRAHKKMYMFSLSVVFPSVRRHGSSYTWQQLLIWIQERVIVPNQHYTDLGDMSHENLHLSVVRHFVYLFICGKKITHTSYTILLKESDPSFKLFWR